MSNWEGRDIVHRDHGRGRVVTDLADETHQKGRMLAWFDGWLRKWVDANNCELVGGQG